MSRLSWAEACIRRLREYDWISDGLAEDVRQWALEQDLGQVRCKGTTHDWLGGGLWACPHCGAQV